MRGHSRRPLAAVMAALMLPGCAGNPAPRGWLAPPPAALADPHGAWVEIELAGRASLRGELLAVEADSVYVLGQDGVVYPVARSATREAQLAFYAGQWGGLAGWTAMGAVGTITNGWFLVFTLPTWLIAGPWASAVESRAPLRRVRDPAQWSAVRLYARFPQGLPPGLPRHLPIKPARTPSSR